MHVNFTLNTIKSLSAPLLCASKIWIFIFIKAINLKNLILCVNLYIMNMNANLYIMKMAVNHYLMTLAINLYFVLVLVVLNQQLLKVKVSI